MKALPIEEHVRGVVKDLLRTRGIAHSGLVTDLNGTKKVPLKGLKYRLSIQVTTNINACAVTLLARNCLFPRCYCSTACASL
jgi:hypothetical protein